MAHKFDPRHKGRLDSPERRKRLNPERVLSLLPLEPEQVVADIGCGPGFFTLPLAHRLTNGQVVALDISEEMLATVREKVASAGVGNVELRASGEANFPVPPASLDGAFLAFVLHELEQKTTFLEQVNESLKPGGWLAVLEWYKKQTGHGPPPHERLALEEVQALAAGAGFTVTREQELNEDHYLVLLKRPDV